MLQTISACSDHGGVRGQRSYHYGERGVRDVSVVQLDVHVVHAVFFWNEANSIHARVHFLQTEVTYWGYGSKDD